MKAEEGLSKENFESLKQKAQIPVINLLTIPDQSDSNGALADSCINSLKFGMYVSISSRILQHQRKKMMPLFPLLMQDYDVFRGKENNENVLLFIPKTAGNLEKNDQLRLDELGFCSNNLMKIDMVKFIESLFDGKQSLSIQFLENW